MMVWKQEAVLYMWDNNVGVMVVMMMMMTEVMTMMMKVMMMVSVESNSRE